MVKRLRIICKKIERNFARLLSSIKRRKKRQGLPIRLHSSSKGLPMFNLKSKRTYIIRLLTRI